jgi:mono/diheme cytochrome c family protein
MKYLALFLLLYLNMLLYSCSDNGTESAESTSSGYKVFMTGGKGEELFNSNCITCHSLRYIDMQPQFSRKTWQKIVDKMVKNFGAPISDSSANEIVDYLVLVKGKE